MCIQCGADGAAIKSRASLSCPPPSPPPPFVALPHGQSDARGLAKSSASTGALYSLWSSVAVALCSLLLLCVVGMCVRRCCRRGRRKGRALTTTTATLQRWKRFPRVELWRRPTKKKEMETSTPPNRLQVTQLPLPLASQRGGMFTCMDGVAAKQCSTASSPSVWDHCKSRVTDVTHECAPLLNGRRTYGTATRS